MVKVGLGRPLSEGIKARLMASEPEVLERWIEEVARCSDAAELERWLTRTFPAPAR